MKTIFTFSKQILYLESDNHFRLDVINFFSTGCSIKTPS
jgi:hypothetical protein